MNADNQEGRSRLADDHVGLVVEVFRMLADATRVHLLWALVDRELSVNDLADRIGKPAPSVSQHLAKLRMARLVSTRRAGTKIFAPHSHDAADSVDDALESSAVGIRAVKISVVILGLTAVVHAYPARAG